MLYNELYLKINMIIKIVCKIKKRGCLLDMKKRITTMGVATMLLVSAIATSVFAQNINTSVSGGWSESTGYYINNAEGTTEAYTPSTSEVSNLQVLSESDASVMAINTPSATPDKHIGKRLKKIFDNGGGDTASAAYGETLWYYKYHYTTARMESRDGTVKTTSYRQWGDNATKATSPYYVPKLFENTEARTYWGS